MRTLCKVTVVAISAVSSMSLLAAASTAAGGADDQTGRFFVRFGEAPGALQRELIESLGGKVRHTYRYVPALSAELSPEAVEALVASGYVVESVGKVYAMDTELDSSWGVKRIGGGYNHEVNIRGTGVKVAVVDTGVNYTHPDLAPLYRGGIDFVNNDNDPMDDHGHGTHCAGILTAIDNEAGVVGVASDVELYAVKVLDAGGSGAWDDIAASVEWAIENGIQITSQSLGGIGNPGTVVEDAYAAGNSAGIFQAAAAGNYGSLFGVLYPARWSSCVAVAATDQNNKKAGFSSTGPQVDLAAPGVDVYSTYLGTGYTTMSGTSMACPHVAGAAAAILGEGIADTDGNGRVNDDLLLRLAATAIDIGTVGKDNQTGYGLIVASSAVRNPMWIANTNLVAGQPATLSVSRATPGASVSFFYGATKNPGPIDSLGVVLSVPAPQFIGSAVADANGEASISVNIPGGSSGLRVHIQAASSHHVSLAKTVVIN